MTDMFSRKYDYSFGQKIEFTEDLKRIIYIVDNMDITHYNNKFKSHLNEDCHPTNEGIKDIIDKSIKCIFPSNIKRDVIIEYVSKKNLISIVTELSKEITDQIFKSYLVNSKNTYMQTYELSNLKDTSIQITFELLEEFSKIRLDVLSCIDAAYEEDPASYSYNEVILSYPFLKVIAIHRIAHFLYKKKVPILPRMMSEYMHSLTGIDIHPGAQIGKACFIDHGTGVVVGETTNIGENVKIYQGVTLGAISFEKNEANRIIKGKKRHPTIENNVTIYANATILGGDTVVGSNSIIGSNSWITESVPENTIIKVNRKKTNQSYKKIDNYE